jgi:hypothetical protein
MLVVARRRVVPVMTHRGLVSLLVLTHRGVISLLVVARHGVTMVVAHRGVTGVLVVSRTGARLGLVWFGGWVIVSVVHVLS